MPCCDSGSLNATTCVKTKNYHKRSCIQIKKPELSSKSAISQKKKSNYVYIIFSSIFKFCEPAQVPTKTHDRQLCLSSFHFTNSWPSQWDDKEANRHLQQINPDTMILKLTLTWLCTTARRLCYAKQHLSLMVSNCKLNLSELLASFQGSRFSKSCKTQPGEYLIVVCFQSSSRKTLPISVLFCEKANKATKM